MLLSPGVTSMICPEAQMFDATLLWVSMTPLGCPVVPEV